MAWSKPVKSPEAPEYESAHPLAPKPETRFSARREAEEDDYAPRYVDVPRRRRSIRAGRRNLFWGIALFFAGLFVLALGVLMAGPRAILWPGVAGVTFAVLWVLARLKIFHQRNGVFFALALVMLTGAVLSVCERGFEVLAASRAGGLAQGPGGESAKVPAPAAPPLLTRAFKLAPVDPAAGTRVRIVDDTEVTIGGNVYRVSAGETFPFEGAKEGEVTFAAGEFKARLPQAAVEILAPERAGASGEPDAGGPVGAAGIAVPDKPQDPAAVEITRRAQAEAARRFPALADPKSPENEQFVSTYKDLKSRNSTLLDDPQWPIQLAEILAQRTGWQEVEAGAGDEIVGSGPPPRILPDPEVSPAPADLPEMPAPSNGPDRADLSGESDLDTPPPPPPTPR